MGSSNWGLGLTKYLSSLRTLLNYLYCNIILAMSNREKGSFENGNGYSPELEVQERLAESARLSAISNAYRIKMMSNYSLAAVAGISTLSLVIFNLMSPENAPNGHADYLEWLYSEWSCRAYFAATGILLAVGRYNTNKGYRAAEGAGAAAEEAQMIAVEAAASRRIAGDSEE